MPVMQKAFAYLRVSGKNQLHGDGMRRQLEAIRTYAKANDIVIAQVFEERGVSGTLETMDRPAWCRLLAALLSNGVRMVIIEKLDRLARELLVQENVLADFRRRGFDLVSVCEPDLLATDPTRVLMRQIMGGIAQYEKSQIVLRMRVARLRLRAQNGRCEGRKPYGFYPGEPEVVARMRELRGTGLSFARIAAQLNADGVKPRKGVRWYVSSVNNALSRA